MCLYVFVCRNEEVQSVRDLKPKDMSDKVTQARYAHKV